MTATIGICLATWNGAAFLNRQLESIAAQSFSDWHLYVRDDGSSDGTHRLLEGFFMQHPDRVTLVHDELGQLGACANFAALMAGTTEPYVAFSDQDDIWHEDKLTRTLDALRTLERTAAPDFPCMVHADRRLVDGQGQEIAASYWRSRKLAPGRLGAERHLSFCIAAGSTMLINRALVCKASPVPPEARMYDCWLELTAQFFGAVAALDETVLDHRRHGGNASGPSQENDSPAQRRFSARVRRLLYSRETQREIYRLYMRQAAAFRTRYRADLSDIATQRLDQFLSLPRRGVSGRLKELFARRVTPPGLGRGLALMLLAAERP